MRSDAYDAVRTVIRTLGGKGMGPHLLDCEYSERWRRTQAAGRAQFQGLAAHGGNSRS